MERHKSALHVEAFHWQCLPIAFFCRAAERQRLVDPQPAGGVLADQEGAGGKRQQRDHRRSR